MVFVLKTGSRGNDVKTLQTKLNAILKPSPKLVTDGVYGHKTRGTVLRFQRENWLVEDGETGPCTWNALMGTETYAPILYTIPFIPQPSETTCWAASTAMLTNTTVDTVINRTPGDLILDDDSLANFSGTNDPVTGANKFARANSLRLVAAAQSWLPRGIVSMLRGGPLMFDMLWSMKDYVKGAASSGHMITVVGIRGDDDASGKGTTLRIYDPWPVDHGKKYSFGYLDWMQQVPMSTYHIYQKG